MSVLLRRELESLERHILKLGTMVEEALNKAIVALASRRAELAAEVIAGDDLIDQREVEFDEECLKILALHQPVAHDLRFVIAVMKVNNDLERVGDRAVSIAARAAYLATHEPLAADLNIPLMAEKVKLMVASSLNSLVELDADMARNVIRDDDAVDSLRDEMRDALLDLMRKDASLLDLSMQSLEVVRHLERIGDLAVHIAEEVIFLVEGKMIRHHHDEHFRQQREMHR